jgi:hypothetical protein
MKSLTEIRVEVEDIGYSGHVGINVAGITGFIEDYPGVTEVEINNASRYLVGIFALLAVELYPWIEHEAQGHRCHSLWYPPGSPETAWSSSEVPQRLGDCCAMDISGLKPVYDIDDPPWMQFIVPEESAEEWRKRAKDSLRHIAKCLS